MSSGFCFLASISVCNIVGSIYREYYRSFLHFLRELFGCFHLNENKILAFEEKSVLKVFMSKYNTKQTNTKFL